VQHDCAATEPISDDHNRSRQARQADLGNDKLKLSIPQLVTDPRNGGATGALAAWLLPVPAFVFVPALVPVPLPVLFPPSAAPTMIRTMTPPTIPSVIFSPRRRFRGGWW
jgi:hypothetical protein